MKINLEVKEPPTYKYNPDYPYNRKLFKLSPKSSNYTKDNKNHVYILMRTQNPKQYVMLIKEAPIAAHRMLSIIHEDQIKHYLDNNLWEVVES